MNIKNKFRNRDTSLEQRSPLQPVRPLHDVEHWFDELGRQGWLHPFSRDWPKEVRRAMPFESRIPRVDMVDKDSEILIRAEMPGVEKDDIEISLSDQTVTIEAHTSVEETEEKEAFYRKEMSHGDFHRTLTLPCSIDDTKVKAGFENGVLELTLTKIEKSTRKRVKVD